MSTEHSRHQIYVPQLVIYDLHEYQQIYKFQLLQDITTPLIYLLDSKSIRVDVSSINNADIVRCVEKLEANLKYLLNQLFDSTTQLIEKQNGFESVLESDRFKSTYSSSCPSNSSATYHSNQTSTVLASEAWEEGLVTKDLVVRLQTNPSTLKKYLRDLKQIRWAVERDPDRLGWVYDPLLERYYPVQMCPVETDAAELSALPDVDGLKFGALQSIQNGSFVTESESVHCNKLEYRDGLTQSGLSRLTGIPVTTLQRWKGLSDCSERIRCRTESRYIYWYSQQNRRFYPFRVSSK